jgi:hypothetical protein
MAVHYSLKMVAGFLARFTRSFLGAAFHLVAAQLALSWVNRLSVALRVTEARRVRRRYAIARPHEISVPLSSVARRSGSLQPT